MKVGIDAFFINHPFNGVGQVTAHFLHALRAEDCDFYLYMAEDFSGALPENFHKRVLPLWNNGLMARKWWEARQLPAAVRRDRCDVLISLSQSAAVMPDGFPHVMVVHDIIWALFPRYSDRWHKRLAIRISLRGIRRASHCIAVSQYTKGDMVKHLGMRGDGISVAYIAADPRFRKPVTAEEVQSVLQKHQLTPGYIYHGGGLDERKNARGVIEAYAFLKNENGRGKFSGKLPPLVISGGGAGRAGAEELAKKLGIEASVIWLGMVPQPDLPALYKAASVFLYPSRYEGFGLPVLEAMHQGVPVVTANTSSLPEVGGDAVLYCDPDKPAELVSAVRTILANAETRETLSRRGLERAASFTWDSFVQKLMATVWRVSERSQSGKS